MTPISLLRPWFHVRSGKLATTLSHTRRLDRLARTLLLHWQARAGARSITKCSTLPFVQKTDNLYSFVVGSAEAEAADSKLSPEAGSRLDAFLASCIPDLSRAKAQASVKTGLVTINGKTVSKSSHLVKLGDEIHFQYALPSASRAEPEDLPLQIVYEDTDILVVNKAAGMVVHPSPGHFSGTLVNALLYHLQLPPVEVVCGNPPELPGGSALSDADAQILTPVQYSEDGSAPVVRPGVVHRLDKGTTGLLVLAKNDISHARLCQQFKDRTVRRTYLSILLGVPRPSQGFVQTKIDRSPSDKLKMVSYAADSKRGKVAVSTYNVLEVLASGKAALVEWKLKTGRTHQIRVHATHIGHPLLGDETYSGGVSSSLRRISGSSHARRKSLEPVLMQLNRPALHAKTLGFSHPISGAQMNFTSVTAEDISDTIRSLRNL